LLANQLKQILENLVIISKKAGDEILDVYKDAFQITLKDDLSPLTDADRRANAVITSMLKDLYPEIPILSEEGKEVEFSERKKWDMFWLVDPLDGTKEFVKRNGEFTVNIALIKNQLPIAGIVYAPTKSTYWYGAEGLGSYRMTENLDPKRIRVQESSQAPIRIVSSRSHSSPKLESYLSQFPEYEIVSMGSSLKICLVADSSAHIYPRLGPTMEWDSGAGHAVLKFAGGELIDRETGEELIYNKEILKNSDFICFAPKVKDAYEVL
tara:strand:+ start:183 stop:983 length:801 start_codon:yes stop_codon:yes gene_type:complete